MFCLFDCNPIITLIALIDPKSVAKIHVLLVPGETHWLNSVYIVITIPGNVVCMSGQHLCILSVASPLLRGRRSLYFSGFSKSL